MIDKSAKYMLRPNLLMFSFISPEKWLREREIEKITLRIFQVKRFNDRITR